MACMCGSSLATVMSERHRPWLRLCMTFALGSLALGAAACEAGISSLRVCFLAFMVFEFCVGLYFPSIGVLKSEVVPENVRATVYNMYRVPLNAMVVSLLLTNITIVRIYGLCAVLLAVAFWSMPMIASLTPAKRVK